MSIIEEANALSLKDFEARYLSSFPTFKHFTFTQQGTQIHVDITLVTAKSISAADFEACFALLKSTSADIYRQSSIGWNPKSKRKEMELLDMWFAIAPPSEAQARSSVPQPQIESLDLYSGDTPPSYYTPKFRDLPGESAGDSID